MDYKYEFAESNEYEFFVYIYEMRDGRIFNHYCIIPDRCWNKIDMTFYLPENKFVLFEYFYKFLEEIGINIKEKKFIVGANPTSEVTLTPDEYDRLKMLYKINGRLCNYE